MKARLQKNPLKKFIPLIDRMTYAAAIVETFIVMPQVYQIFHDKNASGVSLFSWTGFEVLNLVWLLYGIAHREKLIIFYASAYGIVQFWVIVGGMLYGAKWL